MNSGPLSTLIRKGLPRKHPDHPKTWQGSIHLDPERFPVVIVNDIQQSEPPSINQAITHKIHTPCLI